MAVGRICLIFVLFEMYSINCRKSNTKKLINFSDSRCNRLKLFGNIMEVIGI